MNTLKEYIQERIEFLRKEIYNFEESSDKVRYDELQSVLSKIEEIENNK